MTFDLQMMYTAMTGVPLVLGMKWIDYLATLGLIHAIVTAFALWYQLREFPRAVKAASHSHPSPEAFILNVSFSFPPGLPLWILPPIVQSAYAMFFLGILWICIYAMFRALGANSARRLVADVEVMGAAGVRMHRLLWLHVVKANSPHDGVKGRGREGVADAHSCHSCPQLLQSYSDRNSKVQLPHFMSLFAMCVAYFFSFVYTVLGHLQELLSLVEIHSPSLSSNSVTNAAKEPSAKNFVFNFIQLQ